METIINALLEFFSAHNFGACTNASCSRHNRFAETHSLLQRSYHITDRLLAAGNYRIFWHYENEELSLFTYFECLNVSSCAECVYLFQTIGDIYIYINIINYNLSCYYVNQVTQLLSNFVFVFITFFTLMSNKYINSEQSQPNYWMVKVALGVSPPFFFHLNPSTKS